jgi:hypothetical protein
LAATVLFTPVTADAAVIYVQSGGNLQAAINAAKPGDTLMLQPGATFTGNFTLPKHGGSNYITIRSGAASDLLPGTNVRMSPAYSAQLPKIKSATTAPALRTLPGAAYWRLMFLEFLPNQLGQGDIIILGDSTSTSLDRVPHHLILDRLLVLADPLHGQKRGICLNSSDTSITNSHIAGMRSVSQDSQAIGGWNGPGTYRIENNYLEAAGEVFMLGGADPSIVGLTPSNVVFRGNTLTRPLRWRDPIVPTPMNVRPSVWSGGSLPAGTYGYRVVARRKAGTEMVKSSPSLEVAVTVGDGGVVALQWDAVADATEYLVYGRNTGTQNQYWRVTLPQFIDTGAAGTAGAPAAVGTVWQVKNLLELKHARNVQIDYNVITNNWAAAQQGTAILISPRNQDGRCSWCVVENVTFEYNVVRHVGMGIKISGYDDTHQSLQTNNIVIRHNEFSDVSKAWGGSGIVIILLSGARAVTFDHNTLISPDGSSIISVDNAPMHEFVFTNNVARHNNYGIKGTNKATGNGTIDYYFPGAVVRRNVLAGGKASNYPGDNMFPAAASFEAHFTDYAGANYRLNPGSDWAFAGTDGLDLGASYPQEQPGVTPLDPPKIQTATLLAGRENGFYTATLQAIGGVTPYTWSIVGGALPAGLSLDAGTGVISGSPMTFGTAQFTVQVEDNGGVRNARPLSMEIEESVAPVQIATTWLADGAETVPYAKALEATGGRGTFVWSIVGGALPAGLSLSPSGVLQGTPLAHGPSSFVVHVADPTSSSRTATQALALTIAPPPNRPPVVTLLPIAGPLPVGATVMMTAHASDPDGAVVRVEFYDGPMLIGTASDTFVLPWFVGERGVHTLRAVAVDDDGAQAASAPVAVDTTSEIVIHAGQVSRMVGDFTLVADASAAGGVRLTNRDRGVVKVTTAQAEPAHYAEFTFFAEAGRPYHVWTRIKADRNQYANDSFYVQFDDVDGRRIGTTSALMVNLEEDSGAGISGWGWQDNGYGIGVMGAPVVFGHTGFQTLRIQPREDGFMIDQIVLSPEQFLETSPGALKNDATIVPR